MRAGAELEVVFVGVERKSGQSPHFGFQLLCGAVDRRQTGHRKLAGVGSGKSRVYIALGVEVSAHRDQIRMNVQHIRYDLRRGGFVSLTLRTGADRNHDLSVDIKFAVCALRIAGIWQEGIHDLRLSEIVGAGIEGGPNPDSDQASFRTRRGLLLLPLIPADQDFRHLQHLRIVA